MNDGKATIALVNPTGTAQGEWILRAEVDIYIQAKVSEMLSGGLKDWLRRPGTRDELIEAQLVCGNSCGGGDPHGHVCNEDTRLSAQRKKSLRRQKTHYFGFDNPAGQLPLLPGQTKIWTVPPYRLGRVIEMLYFRPTMDNVNNQPATNWDDIVVTITGEDGVLWTEFGGGRHMPGATPCCLLEAFEDDCIGWAEGFFVKLHHKGPNGSPSMVSAAMDWQYLFFRQKSELRPNWCWPQLRVSVKG